MKFRAFSQERVHPETFPRKDSRRIREAAELRIVATGSYFASCSYKPLETTISRDDQRSITKIVTIIQTFHIICAGRSCLEFRSLSPHEFMRFVTDVSIYEMSIFYHHWFLSLGIAKKRSVMGGKSESLIFSPSGIKQRRHFFLRES